MNTTTKKMLLIPPETLNMIKDADEKAVKDPKILDDAMMTVLSSKADPETKLRQYQQALKQYLYFRTKTAQEPHQVQLAEQGGQEKTEGVESSLKSLVSELPISNQPKAAKLVKFLLGKPRGIGWSDTGDIKVNGVRLFDSNILEAVKTLSTSTRTAPKTIDDGVRKFIGALKRSGVPDSAIANKRLWDQVSEIPYSEEDNEPDTSLQTIGEEEAQPGPSSIAPVIVTPRTSTRKRKPNVLKWEPYRR